jgi:hypothetical protein
MGKATTTKRVNQTQLQEHAGADTMTVRGNQATDEEKEIEVPGLSDQEVQAKLDTYTYDEEHGMTQGEKQLRAVRQKARAVLAGSDTFTPAQVQTLVARLALRELGEEE